jgi:hypothetical protein
MRLANVLFILSICAFPRMAGALDFREPKAKELYQSGSRLGVNSLTGSTWLQIAGRPLYDFRQSPWTPGPVGTAEDGQFAPEEVMGRSRMQQRTELEFLSGTGVAGPALVVRSFEPGQESAVTEYSVPLLAGEGGLEFRITREGNYQLEKDYNGGFGESTAVLSCRQKGADLLVCAATFAAAFPNQAPSVLRPFIGSVFYYSLYRKKQKTFISAAAAGKSPAAEVPLATSAKGYRCAMRWPGGQGHTEIMTFALLNRPMRLGKGSMVGVGASWDAALPTVTDRVVVLKAVDEGGSTTFGILNSTNQNFNADWDVSDKIQNKAGLPMVGTIRVPHGGGESEVHYPPAWFQDAKDYAKTSAEAPTQAFCREQDVPVPADPYSLDAGVLK